MLSVMTGSAISDKKISAISAHWLHTGCTDHTAHWFSHFRQEAYGFTSDRVFNGDGAGLEAERGRRWLPADWPRRDGMSVLDSAHARA